MATNRQGVTRRGFMRIAGASGLSSVLLSCAGCRQLTATLRKSGRSAANGKKVIVIGIDGMDPRLCERMMPAGELPNLDRMRQAGGYRRLGTSVPPQSPVAWADFITGAGPGVHGIFDFIHRDPAMQCAPFFSAAQTIRGNDGWDIEDHHIPLDFWPFNHSPTRTLLLRRGTPFWDYLDAAGVPAHIYDIPSNYPPSPSSHAHVLCLSGLGVPDMLGTYGTYQYFSETVKRPVLEAGGMRKPLVFEGHTASGTLIGPENTCLKKPASMNVDFQIHRHPTKNVARVDLQGRTIVLNEGEWSDWCKVRFEVVMPSFLPNSQVSGICRFYLQRVHPDLCLYVTPLNIDPSDPGGQSISEPPEFVAEISAALGLFYTTGFQEDHKALSNGVFDDEEYRRQADHVLGERLNLLDYALNRYDDGLLFFYFSSTDLQAHMFWWDSNDKHPVRSREQAGKYSGVIEELYKRLDTVIGDLVNEFGEEATFFVISDHGFCNFRRQVNVNTWLRDNGYLAPADCQALMYDPRYPFRRLPDWTRTRAYGLGMNALYLNLSNRERDGIVDPAQRDELTAEVKQKLLALRDPADGQPVLAAVYRTDQVYSGPEVKNAPDLVIGYRRGYRASWATILGQMTDKVITDNDSAWSADHCMDAGEVPGVLFCNRPILHEKPALVDLAPTILEEFAIRTPEGMTGRSLFRSGGMAGVAPGTME